MFTMNLKAEDARIDVLKARFDEVVNGRVKNEKWHYDLDGFMDLGTPKGEYPGLKEHAQLNTKSASDLLREAVAIMVKP